MKRTEMPPSTTPMRACGKRWDTEAEALNSKRAQDPTMVVLGCWCEGFHVRKRRAVTVAGMAAAVHDTGPDTKTRAAVYARDGHQCVCCGESVIGRPHSCGHIVRRSQGGPSTFTNLLTFLGLGNGLLPDDQDHHHRIDSRIDPADEAAGYTARSWQDRASVRVLYVTEWGSQEWWQLLADGTREPCEASRRVAA
jgi:5-methylcytosine-specific restriction endonuclease McrA